MEDLRLSQVAVALIMAPSRSCGRINQVIVVFKSNTRGDSLGYEVVISSNVKYSSIMSLKQEILSMPLNTRRHGRYCVLKLTSARITTTPVSC